ncbi:organic solute transporter Ostalpha-domain-containing protein [Schizophyllum fasciatum]
MAERCYKEVAPDGPSLFQNGKLVIQSASIGWLVSGVFTLIACAASFWLIDKHLQWYHNKHEQRHIVRILFLVPIYAIVSLASYFFWNHSTPIILVRDCYESTVLTSFFYLLLLYLSPDYQTQQMIFAKEGLSHEADQQAIRSGTNVKKWVLPLGFVKWKPADGLYFLQLMKWGVLQYCVIRPLCTLAAVILDYAGLYCEASWGLGWGHIYLTIIISISVTIAMYCLIQLYVVVAEYLAPQKPLLKLFAIKAVVFLTFWQATFLSVLTMFGVVKDTKYMTAEDINIGIGALLETFEMACFALVHVKAFTYKVYKPFHLPDSTAAPIERTRRLRSLGHAFDFRETARELWVGCKYLWQRVRGREPKLDVPAKRHTYYESVFGRPRIADITAPQTEKGKVRHSGNEKNGIIEQQEATLPDLPIDAFDENVAVGERQWLGVGDSAKYDLHVGYLQREPSEGLEKQFEGELLSRGCVDRDVIADPAHLTTIREDDVPARRQQRSWWRNMYDRISQTGNEAQEMHPAMPRSALGYGRQSDYLQQRLLEEEVDYDEPPPPSVLYSPGDMRGRYQDHYDGTDLDAEAPASCFRPLDPSLRSSRTHRAAHRQSAPPQSPYIGSHRPPLYRVDSMMARIFPASQNPSSSALHQPTSSVQSLPSVETDGVRPSLATPRARLVPGTPLPVGSPAVGERVVQDGFAEAREADSQEAHVMRVTPAPAPAYAAGRSTGAADHAEAPRLSSPSHTPRTLRSPRHRGESPKRSFTNRASDTQLPSPSSSRYPAGAAVGTSHWRDAASQSRLPELPRGAGKPRLFSDRSPPSPSRRPVPRMPAPLAQQPGIEGVTLPAQSYDPMNLGGDTYFLRPS